MRAVWLAFVVAGCTQRTDLLAAASTGPACAAPGPPTVLGDGGSCAGALAARRLRRALCTCGNLSLSKGLFTTGGGPMGPMGPPVPAPRPAGVGSDLAVEVSGPLQLAGVLEAGAGIRLDGTSTVLGALRAGGALSAGSFLSVDGDAFVRGEVSGRVEVRGGLHVPPGATVGSSVTAAAVLREPVPVPEPCGCNGAPTLDVAALIAERARHHDDARVGLSPEAFVAGTGPRALDLPCGQYFLAAVRTQGGSDLELRVHGRASLFVAGNVELAGGLRVELDPGAELDLVVAGSFSAHAGVVGSRMASSVRIWLGGSSMRLGAQATLSAALHAPDTVLLTDGDLTVTGAVLAHALSVTGDVVARYEPQILAGGIGCGEAPQPPAQ